MQSIIKKNILTLVTFAVGVSCVDLKESPPSLLNPKAFYSTEKEFDAALASVYRPLFSDWESFDYYILHLTSGAEDIFTKAANFRNLDRLKPTDQEVAIIGIWKRLYQAIGNANAVIANLSNAKNIPPTKLGAIEGQAKFARAFAFFYLVRWFGEVQLTTFQNQNNIRTLKQATVPQIYASIISNLKDAEAKLPSEFPERGKPTKWAAKSLLAKVYLTMAGWPIEDASNYIKAKDKAKEVIDSKRFQLEPNFADLWVQKNRLTNKEFIFGFYGSIAAGGRASGSHLHRSTRSPKEDGGWGDFSSESRFYNAFPSGPRKNATFTSQIVTKNPNGTTTNTPLDPPFPAKYRDAGRIVGFNGEGFFVILRYADVLLMFAEAANQSEGGPSTAAYDAINQVKRRAAGLLAKRNPTSAERQAADLAPGMSQADFDKAVIAERNWELAFEGNRWFDLVRKKMVVSVNKDTHSNVTPNNRLLPKPGQELIPGVLKQNPGY